MLTGQLQIAWLVIYVSHLGTIRGSIQKTASRAITTWVFPHAAPAPLLTTQPQADLTDENTVKFNLLFPFQRLVERYLAFFVDADCLGISFCGYCKWLSFKKKCAGFDGEKTPKKQQVELNKGLQSEWRPKSLQSQNKDLLPWVSVLFTPL